MVRYFIMSELDKKMNELQEMADFKDFGKKEERICGMYGELPKVRIGKFWISQMSNVEGEKNIWVQDDERGEGAEFGGKEFEEDFQSLFNKHF